MTHDSCLTKIFHDIGNAVSMLNFYVELLKGGYDSFSLEELSTINDNILVQLNVLKCAFQSDCSPRIIEYLVSYAKYKHKSLVIVGIDNKYLRLVVNIVVAVVGVLSRNGTIEVAAFDDNFYVKLQGKIKESTPEFVRSLNLYTKDNPVSQYVYDFLIKNGLIIIGKFISDDEFEIRLASNV